MTDPLTPGPEADALVAEAMGWTELRMHPAGGPPWGHPPNDRTHNTVPAYTTSWAGLGEMVEWMQSAPRNDCLTLVWMGSLAGGGMAWDAHFRMAGKHGVADTAPMAVAEALLAAVEKEKNRG